MKKATLVWEKYYTDFLTPTAAYLKLKGASEYSFLLESVQGGEYRGRFSIIGIDPDLVWKCTPSKAYLSKNNSPFLPLEADVLASLRQLIQESQFDVPDHLPSISSGLIGYLSYDAIRLIEKNIPDQNPDPIDIPLGVFIRPTIMLVFDAVDQSLTISSVIWPTDLHKQAKNRIQSVIKKLGTKTMTQYFVKMDRNYPLNLQSNFTEETFCQMVDRAKDYIYAGDIFQVVPSQRFSAPMTLPPFAVYQSLRHINPSPFLFFLDFKSFSIVGASPEIMVRLRSGIVTIRPLAGTRPRGKNQKEDEALAQELLSDPKEIAEHLMLIDLSRNDVGRVSLPGTVKVTQKMMVEYYSHVMHISSNVEGMLRPELDSLDALLSGLPVGTVSGAPKIRAMQIIDELEPCKRSFYAGCVGFFTPNGEMDTCIALRTALIKDQQIYIQAGAGIVADSNPQKEYQETLNKAQALVKAVEKAVNYCLANK